MEKKLYPDRELFIDYKVRNTSPRVIKLVIGTANLTSKWLNQDSFNRYDWDNE